MPLTLFIYALPYIHIFECFGLRGGIRVKKILFVCTGNSARSQMAEALLRHLAPSQYQVASAGARPKAINPHTLATLERYQISTDGLRSQHIDDFKLEQFDYVISLCDRARAECADLPRAREIIAWHFADPAEANTVTAFNDVFLAIADQLRLFMSLNHKDMDTSVKPILDPLTVMKCLADETRIHLLMFIHQHAPVPVNALVAVLHQSQPKISRHLAQLRKCGLVETKREGQQINYALNSELPSWTRELINTIVSSQLGYLNAWKALPQRTKGDANET